MDLYSKEMLLLNKNNNVEHLLMTSRKIKLLEFRKSCMIWWVSIHRKLFRKNFFLIFNLIYLIIWYLQWYVRYLCYVFWYKNDHFKQRQFLQMRCSTVMVFLGPHLAIKLTYRYKVTVLLDNARCSHVPRIGVHRTVRKKSPILNLSSSTYV